MTVRLLLIVTLFLAAGCVIHDRTASRVLADADSYVVHGDYPAAMAAYEAYLARNPTTDDVHRVRAARALLTELMNVRAERERLVAREAELTRAMQAREAQRESELGAREAELTQKRDQREAELLKESAAREAELRSQVAVREGELARLRQELSARQAEASRLREDLEALKRTDLQIERRRR